MWYSTGCHQRHLHQSLFAVVKPQMDRHYRTSSPGLSWKLLLNECSCSSTYIIKWNETRWIRLTWRRLGDSWERHGISSANWRHRTYRHHVDRVTHQAMNLPHWPLSHVRHQLLTHVFRCILYIDHRLFIHHCPWHTAIQRSCDSMGTEWSVCFWTTLCFLCSFNASTLLVGREEGHLKRFHSSWMKLTAPWHPYWMWHCCFQKDAENTFLKLIF